MYPYPVLPTKPQVAMALEQEGISPLISAILTARGVENIQEAQAILHPSEILAHDPFLLESMEKVVPRIEKALETGEFISVYGDYDVDGITATALLTHYLQSRGGKVLPYIPQRIGEGYGLNEIALKELKRQGISLIITVDCGISGKEQVAFAKKLGIEIIITDHHSCPQELPQAYAILNPRLGTYPFPDLAGVGVAMKLVEALTPTAQREAVFAVYSDLVAVGTVADVMPMEGENRYFVREGLKKLNKNPHLGLNYILEEIGVSQRKINTGTIGYNLAPRINAAGRLDRTEVALNLLLTTDPQKAQAYAKELCLLNIQRQDIEGEIFRQCLAFLEETPPETLVFLQNDKWHAGVVGIVASRLGERYHLPTVMICCRDGVGKGSCRTFGQVNLYDLLTQVSDLLLGFGGHAQAAGFTVAEENIPALELAMKKQLRQQESTALKKVQAVDVCCKFSQITLKEVENLDLLEPTGANCPRPSFLVEAVEVVGASLVGGGKHLRLRLKQNGVEISGIFFHYMGDPVYIGVLLDLAFHLQINHYRGESTPQLQIFSMNLANETDGLFQKWKRGGQFTTEEAQALLPKEEDVLSLFHTLKTEPITAQRFSLLCQAMEQQASLPPQQGEICLALLREANLVQLSQEKEGFSLKITPSPRDFQLENSNLYRHLQSLSGKQES